MGPFRKILWWVCIVNIACLGIVASALALRLFTGIGFDGIIGGALLGITTVPFLYAILSKIIVLAETVLTLALIIVDFLKTKKIVKTDLLLLFLFVLSMPFWGHIFSIVVNIT